MIKNFDSLKAQLTELASVINSFKSEAVQLRILELIFQVSSSESAEPDPANGLEQRNRTLSHRRRRPKARGESEHGNTRRKAARKGRKGGATILAELVDEGFFKQKRTINDVIRHASSAKARILKAGELSGPLGRFVRDSRLKREKNADGQYEYIKQ